MPYSKPCTILIHVSARCLVSFLITPQQVPITEYMRHGYLTFQKTSTATILSGDYIMPCQGKAILRLSITGV